jgi:hypothetical protein
MKKLLTSPFWPLVLDYLILFCYLLETELEIVEQNVHNNYSWNYLGRIRSCLKTINSYFQISQSAETRSPPTRACRGPSTENTSPPRLSSMSRSNKTRFQTCSLYLTNLAIFCYLRRSENKFLQFRFLFFKVFSPQLIKICIRLSKGQIN